MTEEKIFLVKTNQSMEQLAKEGIISETSAVELTKEEIEVLKRLIKVRYEIWNNLKTNVKGRKKHLEESKNLLKKLESV